MSPSFWRNCSTRSSGRNCLITFLWRGIIYQRASPPGPGVQKWPTVNYRVHQLQLQRTEEATFCRLKFKVPKILFLCSIGEIYLRKKSVLNIYLTWQDISDNSMFTHRLCALQRRWENNWSISLISWTSESKNQNSKLLIDQLSPHRLRKYTSANNTSSLDTGNQFE